GRHRVRERARAGAGGVHPLPDGPARRGLPARGRAASPAAPHAAGGQRTPCARHGGTSSKPPDAAAWRRATSSALSSRDDASSDSREGCARAPICSGASNRMPSQSRTDAAATPVTTLTTGSAPAIDKSGGRDPSAPGRCPMILRFALRSVLPGLLLYTLCAPPPARANPAPGPLRFIAPTPVAGSVVTSTTVSVRLDAECTVDPSTLAVS